MAVVIVTFECPECEHEWDGIQQPKGLRQWETCPNCGADDGENCWDCEVNVVDVGGGLMCTACHRTLCWYCTYDFMSAHISGLINTDSAVCGETYFEL